METASVRRPNFFDLIYGVLFSPTDTFRVLSDVLPIGQAVATLFILTLSNAVVSFSFFRTAFKDIPGVNPELIPVFSGLFPLVLAFAVAFVGLKWFVFGAILHLMAELLGGKGTPKGTLTVYALASLPGVFIIPVEILLKLLQVPEIAAAAMSGAVRIAVMIWGIVVLVIGLREIHSFSTGNAVLTIITPLVVFVVVSVAFIFVTLGALVPLFHLP